MSLLTGVEQDAVELYFVRVPNLRWHRALELLGALVIDGGAVANLAGATQTEIYEVLGERATAADAADGAGTDGI